MYSHDSFASGSGTNGFSDHVEPNILFSTIETIREAEMQYV